MTPRPHTGATPTAPRTRADELEQTFTKGPYNNSTAGAQVWSPYDYFRVARSKSSEISKMKPTSRRFVLPPAPPPTSAPNPPMPARRAGAGCNSHHHLGHEPFINPHPILISNARVFIFPRRARALMNSCRSRHLSHKSHQSGTTTSNTSTAKKESSQRSHPSSQCFFWKQGGYPSPFGKAGFVAQWVQYWVFTNWAG